MTKVVEATGDGACLFNAVAIGLGIEILSGRLDGHKDAPGYQRLLDAFANHHPQFNPKSWDNLKQWIVHYNNSRDWELILSPVLFKLNQEYQAQLENEVLNELTNFIRDNKAGIENQQPLYLLDFSKCPKIDNLNIKVKQDLINNILPVIRGWDQNQDFSVFRHLVSTQAKAQLENLTGLVKADQNAFQRGYGCHDLKGMADALSLTLIENERDNPVDTNAKIHLQNEEQHWNVMCSDADFNQLVYFGPQQLNMTSLEAFHGIQQVASPIQPHSQQDISELPQPTVLAANTPPSEQTVSGGSALEQKQTPLADTVESDEAKLARLKQTVFNATNTYTQYSEKNGFFSFFHRHGSSGRSRANKFNAEFASITDYAEAKNRLVDYLIDSKNGNTYPHSFRTMLLNELQGSTPRATLNETSTQFTAKLDELIIGLTMDSEAISNKSLG